MNPSNSIYCRQVLQKVFVAAALALTPPFAVPQAAWADSLQQTQQTIRGTVTDEKGEPIIGATITVVGRNASQGTITDFDGHFDIKAPRGAKLKISTGSAFLPSTMRAMAATWALARSST